MAKYGKGFCKWGKKLCAAVLVVGLIAPLSPRISVQVDAADDKGVELQFVGTRQETSAQMISDEKESLDIKAIMHGDYQMKAGNEAFQVLTPKPPTASPPSGYDPSVPELEEVKGHFSFTGSTPTYTLKPVKAHLLPDPGVNASKDYTLKPIFTSNKVVEGQGTFSAAVGTNADGDATSSVYDGNMKVSWPGANLALLGDTGISVEIDPTTREGKVTHVTSYLATIFEKNDPVSITPWDEKTKELKLTVNTDPTSANVINATLNLNTEVLLAQQGLVKIDIIFKSPPSTSLVLQMMTPRAALDAEYDVLSKASAGDGRGLPVMDNGEPYIILTKGDKLGAIKGNMITARKKSIRYNGVIDIAWSWEPEEQRYKDLLTYNTTSEQFTVRVPDVDVPGHLIAVFSYLPTGAPQKLESAPIKIPILIKGLGEPTSLVRNSMFVPRYHDDSGPAVIETETFTGDDKNLPITGLQMEVYDGKTPIKTYNPMSGENPPYDLPPHQYNLDVNFGTSRNAAATMKIKASGTQDALRLETDQGKYTWEAVYKPNRAQPDDPCVQQIKVIAEKEGNVELTFEFYGTDGKLMESNTRKIPISVTDRRPSDDACLKTLTMGAKLLEWDASMPEGDKERLKSLQETFKKIYPTGKIDFGFSPENTTYPAITVPYIVKAITLEPIYRELKNNNSVEVRYNGLTMIVNPKGSPTVTDEIVLPTDGSAADITVVATAQSGKVMQYRLQVTRDVQSSDNALKGIIVKPEQNSPESDYYEVTPSPFDPDQPTYTVSVPYYPDYVWVEAIANSDWASKIEIKKAAEARSLFSTLARVFKQSKTEKIDGLKYDETSTDPGYNETKVSVLVTPETGGESRTYTLNIIREDPSDNVEMVEPKVSYWLKNNLREEIPVELDKYDAPPNRTIFTQIVPFSTNQVRLTITPQDRRAKSITVTGAGQTQEEVHKAAGGAAQPVSFVFKNVGNFFDAKNNLKFEVKIGAEKPDTFTEPPYVINIEREPPSRDNTADITLSNEITGAAIDFGFQIAYKDHTYNLVEIPYEPGDMKVLVTVVPKHAATTIKINTQDPRPLGTGKLGGTASVPLTQGQTTNIVIVLTAEDGSTNTITIPLKFKMPSKAAYLEDLTVGALTFLPSPTPFDKKKTSYQVEVPKGTTTLAVTAKLLKDGSDDDSTNATITINGKTVKDAEGLNVQLSEKTGKITVVVTAQDGKTKRTYTVNYKNWNLIVPKEENTLKSLTVDYGELAPKFAPSTLEYEVYVKPDAKDIRIYPKLKDKNGAMRVVAGKVLSEFDGAYTATIMEDTMDIFIYVWSEKDVSELAGTGKEEGQAPSGEAEGTGTGNDLRLDKAKARTYVLHLYRNDEEKQGSMKPTTSDEIDFDSADSIVIDITKYPIISADVFNKLKTEYPDKSITFKGNDYTIQCFGADLEGVVPNEKSYDLRFSFFTPDENKILDIMDEYGGNSAVDPVYFYFNQHGALPGEMLLTVELGRHYRNQTLYWNYYNDERSRIDYYGYVKTNAKGTFSVPISHFSTYMTTEQKIRGAENKSDQYGNPVPQTEENLNAPRSSNKGIPNTGVGG